LNRIERDDALKQVKGFSKAQYKKFDTKVEAVGFMLGDKSSHLSAVEKEDLFEKFKQGLIWFSLSLSSFIRAFIIINQFSKIFNKKTNVFK
jgi:hypothetical protein